MPNNYILENSLSVLWVVSGPVAVERGKYEVRFTAGPKAPPGMASFDDAGNYVVLWLKDKDGEWRVTWDAPVSERAPPAGQNRT